MSELEPTAQQSAPQRLYSPGVLAVYTALGNLATGCVLYGLNLRARGQRGAGTASIVAGGLFGVPFLLSPYLTGGARTALFALSGIGAINVYRLERGPYAKARREGARPARWWPPAIVLLALGGLLSLVEAWIKPAA